TDFGYTQRGQVFLVMEYLAGEDLGDTIDREGRFAWPRAFRIVSQAASALAAAHAQGVVHRDIKPENFFRIQRGDDPDYIKVLDFGIAKVSSDRIASSVRDAASSSSSALVGTPEYIAPELLTGVEVDLRVDIYALGVVLYQLLIGVTPFRGDTVLEVLSQHALDDPVPPREAAPDADIPESVEAIVMRCLARNPDDRFQTASELKSAVDGQIAELQTSGTNVAPRGPELSASETRTGIAAALSIRSRWWAAAAGAAFASLVLTTAALSARPDAEPRAQAPSAAADEPASEDSSVAPPSSSAVERPVAPEAGDDAATTSAPEAALGDPLADDATTEGAAAERPSKPPTLAPAAFKRTVARARGKIKARCGELGIAGMAVTLAVEVDADGRVLRATPEGTMSGSSLGGCVARAIKKLRFKAARRGSVHTATIQL
ncbi:MAG: protein kinase, partial [Myxococcales bacterium]|nr:protein kinase [Myxococcales bacterium]